MPPIVLLGMHRSGTSATARVLNRMGAWLGSEQNVSRRWEHLPLQEVNERILRACGGHWSAPPALEDGWTSRPEVARLAEPARRALADLTSRETFAWKDPRTCLTYPYWRPMMPAEPIVVLAYRHPREVVGSLAKRNDFGEAHTLALWERYNHSALHAAAGLRMAVVRYSDLVGDPVGTARRLHDALRSWGVALPGSPEEAVGEIDPGRRHHSEQGGLAGDCTASQQTMWSYLASLDERHEPFGADPQSLPELGHQSAELIEARAALWRCREENHALAEQLGSRRSLARRLLSRNTEELRRLLRRG